MEEAVGGDRINFIPCVTWVPKGVAKANPDKVEIAQEDLARILKETQENLKELVEGEESENENENPETEEDQSTSQNKEGATGSKKERGTRIKKEAEEDQKDCESRYNLDDYDDEKEDDKLDQLLQLGLLTMHSSNEEDPYVTIKDDQDNDSETENHTILPSDNLIAVGHVDDDAAILEVYVYNGEERSLYIHHDILLPSVPLCMEWLNYDPGDEQLKPGNMMAIGSMSPLIDVWDLDIIDSLQPAYTLGKKAKKKKKIPGVGHTEPVLCLSWHKDVEHVLASGSVDQTVILWDLQVGTPATTIKSFKEKVQCLQWHYKEVHTLLTGDCDGKVRIFDCRTENSFKSWKLDGEIECAIWQSKSSEPYTCLVSTDQGTVFAIDARQEKPLWTLNAHTAACSAIQMSPTCPGCLVTVSSDKSVKVWDILDGKPSYIEESDPRLGNIQCLASCPDAPFLFCMGGDNKENNFKVWDIRESGNVRSRFCNRIGLPADEVEEEEDEGGMDVDNRSEVANAASTSQFHAGEMGGRPKPKFWKKKGGHLDNRRKKW